MKRTLLLALTLALPLMTAASAAAYVRSITSNSRKPLRWTGSNCIVVRANLAGSDDFSGGEELAAVNRSAENWHSVIGSCSYMRFSVQPANGEAKIDFTKSGKNENAIIWVERSWPHDRSAAGITTVFFVDRAQSPQDGRILDADIELNGETFTYSLSGEPGRTDVENTVTHEMGHQLGLDHPCDDKTRNPVPTDDQGKALPNCFPVGNLPAAMKETTMYNFADPGETKKRSPEEDEVKGICSAYPLADAPKACIAVDLTDIDTGCAVAARGNLGASALGLGGLLVTLGALLARRVHRRRRLR